MCAECWTFKNVGIDELIVKHLCYLLGACCTWNRFTGGKTNKQVKNIGHVWCFEQIQLGR